MLRKALAAAAGFEPIEATSRVSGVTFNAPRPEEPVVNPSGGLRFIQRALPLGVKLERIGTSRLAGAFDTFELVFQDTGGHAVAGDPREEDFVRGEFFELEEDDRLRGPATARYAAGLDLDAGDVFDVDFRPRWFDQDYEYFMVGGAEGESRFVGAAALAAPLAAAWTRFASAAVAAPLHSSFVAPELSGGRITVAPSRFAVVGEEIVAGGPRLAETPGAEGSLDAVRRVAAGRRVLARHLAAAGA